MWEKDRKLEKGGHQVPHLFIFTSCPIVISFIQWGLDTVIDSKASTLGGAGAGHHG